MEANIKEMVVNPNKRVGDTSNHWLRHIRGQRFALPCTQGVIESREAMAERGERSRRGALGVLRSQEWLERDQRRQVEMSRRNRMRKVSK